MNIPVQNWLKGTRNYYVGVALYNSFGSNKAAKELFAKGKTPATEKLLLEELTKFVTKTLPPVLTKHPINQSTDLTDAMPESNDAIQQAIRGEWMPLYQRMNYLRHELDQYQGNEPAMIAKRKPLAFEILELEQECMKCWAKLNYYQVNKKLPDVVSEKEIILPTDPLELGIYIENLKKKIRRNRAAMAQPGAKPEYAQRFQDSKALYFKITGNEYAEK